MTTSGRIDEATRERHVREVQTDSFTVLRDHLDRAVLAEWSRVFAPLLEANVRDAADDPNRGAERYYVTLPFTGTFADASIVFDPDVLAICEQLVGRDMVMCQLATDTPLRGSQMQPIHRDSPGLFPEAGTSTPAYQLAVNFPLVDVVRENGPTEIARGTHVLPKDEGMRRIDTHETLLEPVYLNVGDIVIRDVRHLHRGTPNFTDVPRPMVVIGFSRAWLRRPEVSVRVPQSTFAQLTTEQRALLRFEPVVQDEQATATEEVYKNFAY